MALVCGAGERRAVAGSTAETQGAVRAAVEAEYPALFDLYREFHAHPELSFQEKWSAAKVAGELRGAGYAVTEKVGRLGVVAVLTNGPGPTVIIRADMDGLPVREQTGLPYASVAKGVDPNGNEVSVMHACGHDTHMTCLIGVARLLGSGEGRRRWSGTLVLIAQPAEEVVGGARAMLADGLYTRFPRPDYCLALHDFAFLAGLVCYTPGPALAAADSLDIVVHGVGGHGSAPDKAKDPVVLAAQIVMALQTIASREVTPGETAVVTVGSIHGGTKRNIIPDEVRLLLTVRTFSEGTRQKVLASIGRIARGLGQAAGMPEDRLPEIVTRADESVPATYNDPVLAARIGAEFRRWFGEEGAVEVKAVTGSEDFGLFGRVEPKIPTFFFFVGGLAPALDESSRATGKPPPSIHSPFWAPVPEATLKTGVTAMTAAALELMPRR